MPKVENPSSSSWARLGLATFIQIISLVGSAVWVVSWALGKYEANFQNEIELREQIVADIATLKEHDKGKGTVLTAHTHQIDALTNSVSSFKSEFKGDILSLENGLVSLEGEVQVDLIEVKKDIKERLDLIIKLIDEK